MRTSVIAIVAAFLLLAGCSGLPEGSLKKPIIKYKRTDVTGVNLEKVNANVILSAENPNDVSLDFVSMDYELFIEGEKVVKGDDLKFNFLAKATTEIAVPVEVKYTSVFKTAENLTKAVLSGRKSIAYEMKTVFHVDLKMITIPIPVTVKGELPLPEIKAPAIKIPKPKFKF